MICIHFVRDLGRYWEPIGLERKSTGVSVDCISTELGATALHELGALTSPEAVNDSLFAMKLDTNPKWVGKAAENRPLISKQFEREGNRPRIREDQA